MSINKKRQYEDANNKALSKNICVADLVSILSFDYNAMTVDVKPIVKYPDEEKFQSCPPILAVPIAPIMGGSFVFRPWYKPGDIGVVVYLDRDSDNAISDGGEAEPNTERLHSGDDAIFLGGIASGSKKVSGLPQEAICLSTEGAGVYIAVKQNEIEIKGNIKITGDIEVNGNAKVSGDLNVTGHLTASEATAGGINLTSHVHGGIYRGSSTTDGPQ